MFNLNLIKNLSLFIFQTFIETAGFTTNNCLIKIFTPTLSKFRSLSKLG